MASNGLGVNLDASVPPQRITAYDDTHADAQDDGYGNREYDIHKVWACMGRVGTNGVMRAGLVEEGDPFNGWAAGHIEENAGGAYLNLERWNSLLPYNPLGGLATNDYCTFGSLAPATGAALHLGAPLAVQPSFVAEWWNGAAWQALTMTSVPDFTQANGKALQRVIFLLPATWGGATVLGGGVNPGAYYHWRLRLTAPIGAAPQANVGYKDWLEGHFKFFYCNVDLKRGDDTTGANATAFRHEGNFGLRFRAERQLDGNRTNQTQPIQLGKSYPASNRNSYGAPWYVASTRLGAGYRGPRFYGGAMLGRPHTDGVPALCSILGAGGAGEVTDMVFAGFGEIRFGALGGTDLTLAQRVTVCPSVTGPANMNAIQGVNVSGRVEEIVVIKQQGRSQDCGVRQNVNASARLQGLTMSHDDYNLGQLLKSGSGILDLFDMNWGGANKKIAPGIAEIREWRRLPFLIFDDETSLPPPAGIPFRITDSSGFIQALGTLDATGQSAFNNMYPNAPVSGVENKNIILASWWPDTSGVETVLDSFLNIEINPPDLAGWNKNYETRRFKYTFPREVRWNPITMAFELMQWQRRDGRIGLGLARGGSESDVPFYQQSDIQAMLTGSGGQDVSYGGNVTKGLVEHRSIDILTGRLGSTASGEQLVVTIEKDSLPGLFVGATFNAEGVLRKVRDMTDVGDGALTEIYLAEE
jgi:hypothetical protein